VKMVAVPVAQLDTVCFDLLGNVLLHFERGRTQRTIRTGKGRFLRSFNILRLEERHIFLLILLLKFLSFGEGGKTEVQRLFIRTHLGQLQSRAAAAAIFVVSSAAQRRY